MVAVVMVRFKQVKLVNQKKKGFHTDLTVAQIQEDFGRKPIDCTICEEQEAEKESLLETVNESQSSKC